MKRRVFACLLAALMICGLGVTAGATETTTPTEAPQRGEFECGEDMSWAYENGTLTITGQGEMDDFADAAPWAQYREEIKKVVISDGVTYIGARAFRDYDKLETVDFGDSLYEIGQEAFYSCDGLTKIYLPKTFKIFGESAFQNCKNLKEIHSEGVFPSFRQNCLWDTYATIYFPVERPWSADLVEELESAFNGRIEFRASDGSDPYVPTEATTEAATEPETTAPEETEPETTEPPTTEAPTAPETTAPAPETTEAAEPTVIETTEVPAETIAEETEVGGFSLGGLIIGILVVCLVLTVGVLIALMIHKNSRGGKYSR